MKLLKKFLPNLARFSAVFSQIGLASLGSMNSNTVYAQINTSGLFDFQFKDAQSLATRTASNVQNSSGNFGLGQFTLFVDGGITEDMYFSGEIQSDLFALQAKTSNDIELRTAYVTFTNLWRWKSNIAAGKFDTVFGSYPSRRLPLDNPLMDAPLAYSYRVNLDPNGGFVPATQPEVRTLGMISRELTQTGVKLFGNFNKSKLHYAASLTNNPVSNPDIINTDNNLAMTGKLTWKADRNTNFGASLSQGGYLDSLGRFNALNPATFNPAFGALTGSGNLSGYKNSLAGMFWNQRYQRWNLHTEYIATTYQAPNQALATRDLKANNLYLEGKYNFTRTLFAAGRYDSLDFDDTVRTTTTTGAAGRRTWDDDLVRTEIGMGTFLNPSALCKLSYQMNNYDLPANAKDFNVVAGSVSVTF